MHAPQPKVGALVELGVVSSGSATSAKSRAGRALRRRARRAAARAGRPPTPTRPRKRSTRAATRTSYCDRRAGAVTTTIASPSAPISRASSLWSSASSRPLPHHQPLSAKPTASSANRARSSASEARAATRRDGGRDDERARAAGAAESPRRARAASDPARRCARPPLQQVAITAPPAPEICARRAGPMPAIASSSRTDEKAPCCSR